MEREDKVIEIQSFNDIITNSSTEIYSSDSNENLKKTLNELGIDWFSPECFEDILRILRRDIDLVFKDHSFIYELELGINRTGRIGRMNWENQELPKLTRDGYCKLRALGYTDSKIQEFFDPIYCELGVYGKIYITYPQMCNLKNKFPGHPRVASKFTSLGTD